MEFMYCIPDLEVFIDETVKKCLLEYDLDSKDTEDVLDDLEKTWPPDSPQTAAGAKRLSEGAARGLKDCNQNNFVWRPKDGILQRPRGDDVIAHPVDYRHGSSPRATADVKAVHPGGQEAVLDDNVCSPGKRLKLSPGRSSPSMETHQASPQSRSETLSPGGTRDTRSPVGKHAKLKSRLQQRYFEDKHDPPKTTENSVLPSNNKGTSINSRTSTTNVYSRSSSINHNKADYQANSAGRTVDSVPNSSSLQQAFNGNNLDLLAQAANLHTLRANQTRPGEPSTGQVSSLPKDENFTKRSYTQEWVSSQNLSSTRAINSTAMSPPSTRYDTIDRTKQYHLESVAPIASENGHCHPGNPSRSQMSNNLSPQNTGSNIGAVGSDPDLNRRAKLLLQHYQNGYHSVIPRDIEAMASDNQSVDVLSRSSHGHHSNSPRTDHADPSSGSKVYLVWNQEAQPHRGSDRYSERPQHTLQSPVQADARFLDNLQSSRIATIIAEELQKDDDGQIVKSRPTVTNRFPSRRTTVPYLQRVMSDEPFLRQTARTPSYRHSYSTPTDLLGSSNTNTWTMDSPQQTNRYPPAGMLLQENSNVSRNSNVPTFLPFHPSVLTSAHHSSTTVVQPAHRSSVSRTVRGEDNAHPSPDDQPEDLSINSRKRKAAQMGHPSLSTSSVESPSIVGYFSSPTSPEVSRSRVPTVESPCSRTSPGNHSDRECDYSSHSQLPRSLLGASGLWEKRGHVHGLDLSKVIPSDNKILVERRRHGVVSSTETLQASASTASSGRLIART